MAHRVTLFTANCSHRGHHNQETNPTPLYGRSPYRPIRIPRLRAASGATSRRQVKLETTKEKKDLLPVPYLVPQAGPDSHLLPPKAVTALNQFWPKVLKNHLNFDPNKIVDGK
ncbi:hypothetical protein E2C01_068134 [Portunus trituberculatus]|uniref:Uncharacterized protein n=1 Tax=Portunus trituberculatus TaxID=210409 RepID=A0A5B7HX33_PORTR|nr:hypothetical protein [Portunus trituberculatus]